MQEEKKTYHSLFRKALEGFTIFYYFSESFEDFSLLNQEKVGRAFLLSQIFAIGNLNLVAI